MSKPPITAKGAEKLREQLNHLKSEERPRIIEAIAEARAHGDLSENAEYHAAKEQQSFLEGRISEIESYLADAQVIDVSNINANGKVVFGATVDLLHLEKNTEVSYQIVGEMEADIDAGLISVSSPIARALISKSEGDVTSVQAPGGEVEYEILEVRYE